jgi:hypothetical protein
MARAVRPTLSGAVIFVSACVAFACSPTSARGPAASSSSSQKAFMNIEPSSIVMTVQNTEQQPLLDVRIAIHPVGGSTEFVKLLSRMESGEKRTVSLGEFNGRDGTPFSLRVVRPKDISVTAIGVTNEKFAMTVPWRQ